MLVTEIKEYVRESGKVSLEELSAYFQMDMEKMRDILNIIMDEDETSLFKTPSCGKCKNCQCHTRKQYRWIN